MTASAYGRLTPRMAWQLAAPHTWPAAILPVLVAAAAALPAVVGQTGDNTDPDADPDAHTNVVEEKHSHPDTR